MTTVSHGGLREIAWTEDGWALEGPLFRALAIVPARLLPGFARLCADSDSLHGQSLAAALRYEIEDVSPDALLCADAWDLIERVHGGATKRVRRVRYWMHGVHPPPVHDHAFAQK